MSGSPESAGRGLADAGRKGALGLRGRKSVRNSFIGPLSTSRSQRFPQSKNGFMGELEQSAS